MTEWDQMGIPVMSTSHNIHVDLVNEGNYAYLTYESMATWIQQSSCDLRIFNSNMYPMLNAIGFQNNSAYVEQASNM